MKSVFYYYSLSIIKSQYIKSYARPMVYMDGKKIPSVENTKCLLIHSDKRLTWY